MNKLTSQIGMMRIHQLRIQKNYQLQTSFQAYGIQFKKGKLHSDMSQDQELTELQQVLLDLMEDDSEFDSFDKLKIVQDFIEDQDEDGITYYTNAA